MSLCVYICTTPCMQVTPCPCPGEPQSSEETKFQLLIIPSKNDFFVRWSQLPMEGVSYSLRTASTNAAVSLTDMARMQNSKHLRTYPFIHVYLLHVCGCCAVCVELCRLAVSIAFIQSQSGTDHTLAGQTEQGIAPDTMYTVSATNGHGIV